MSDWRLFRPIGGVIWHVAMSGTVLTACDLPTEVLTAWAGWGIARISCVPCRAAAGDARPSGLGAGCSVEDVHPVLAGVTHDGRAVLEILNLRGREDGMETQEGLVPTCAIEANMGRLVRLVRGRVTCLACLALERPS